MTAFYNEIDPYAAQWLRNLIAAGEIAPGVVDERPIQEIEARELAGYRQCHFFAGIGVWSRALRDAGWPDDAEIWTGSCPCQPFSAAGQQKGFDDDRHLWPYWYKLIDEFRPAAVVGEQVASALQWLDLVQTDMEAADYAFGAADLCAAGFDGAHIRQRLYFAGLADADTRGYESIFGSSPAKLDSHGKDRGPLVRPKFGHPNSGLANSDDARSQGWDGVPERTDQCPAGTGSVAGGLADTDGGQSGQAGAIQSRGEYGQQSQNDCAGSGLADADNQGSGGRRVQRPGESTSESEGAARERPAGLCEDSNAHAPMLGRHAVDWLYCRDGKWRPVGPGTFPLADAAPARVGRLRAYGNGLDLETATQFAAAVREIAGV